MAKLVYTDFSSYAEVRDLLNHSSVKIRHKIIHDEFDSKILSAMAPDQVLVTSDESLMRAYDYRAVCDAGIALYLDRPLSCRRTLLQALGRVGRYA